MRRAGEDTERSASQEPRRKRARGGPSSVTQPASAPAGSSAREPLVLDLSLTSSDSDVEIVGVQDGPTTEYRRAPAVGPSPGARPPGDEVHTMNWQHDGSSHAVAAFFGIGSGSLALPPFPDFPPEGRRSAASSGGNGSPAGAQPANPPVHAPRRQRADQHERPARSRRPSARAGGVPGFLLASSSSSASAAPAGAAAAAAMRRQTQSGYGRRGTEAAAAAAAASGAFAAGNGGGGSSAGASGTRTLRVRFSPAFPSELGAMALLQRTLLTGGHFTLADILSTPDFLNAGSDYDMLLALESALGGQQSRGLQREELSLLHTHRGAARREDGTTDTCCICLEDFLDPSSHEKIIKLRCSHQFHERCIKKWLTENACCPIDKRRVEV